MILLAEFAITCPYCGETIEVLVDPTEAEQAYIEDCQVCCRPIEISVNLSLDGQIKITVRDENDIF